MRPGYLGDVETMVAKKVASNVKLFKKMHARDLNQGRKLIIQAQHEPTIRLSQLSQRSIKTSLSAARSPRDTYLDRNYYPHLKNVMKRKYTMTKI